jgi:hypothetical protein
LLRSFELIEDQKNEKKTNFALVMLSKLQQHAKIRAKVGW